jgi:hypothetical protein
MRNRRQIREISRMKRFGALSAFDARSDSPDGSTDPGRRRFRRLLSTSVLTLGLAVGSVVAMPGVAHAGPANGGYVECGRNFEGSIVVHPGNTVPAGVVAYEYLGMYYSGAWRLLGPWTSATSGGNGNWYADGGRLFSNSLLFTPPYRNQYYAIYEVFKYQDRVIGQGWYQSYDNGVWSGAPTRFSPWCYT